MNTIILIARPVSVEARQFEHAEQAEQLARWCKGWTGGSSVNPTVRMFTDTGDAATAELGDWVLRGPNGHFYPTKRNVVEAKYMRPVSGGLK